ncbi:MAG TPA: sulfatase-like hydrolase/transferase [Thermoanaerobaculia bacterium]
MRADNNLRRFRASFLQSRYLLLVIYILVVLAVSLVTRCGLLTEDHALTRDAIGRVLAALGVGEAFDLTAALWMAVPFVLYLLVLPERWFRGRVHRALVWAGLGVAVFSVLFVAVVEIFFFAEFNGRFNFVAVDYLMYPTEVMDNIWESYPTGIVLAVLAAVTLGLLVLLRRPVGQAWGRPVRLVHRLAFTFVFALLLAAATATISPAWAHVSEDRALNEIAGNGYYSFWMTLLGSDSPYQGLYASRRPDAVFHRLDRLLAEPAAEPASFVSGSTLRHIRALGPERRMNVVVVLEESLGSEFIGALHPREASLTPAFDALAREGTLLTHAYSTGNRTIRALEATTSSLPPLPGISIVRRPQSRNLFTLPALLRDRGYQTMFVYGGRTLFDGMGSYLRNNGVDRIVEQADYPEGTFTTAWGVADEAIFDKALSEMDALHASGRPFYSLVLSVSNHRPFQFPQDHVQWLPGLDRRENAVRYADYALGRFLRQARSHDFFANTLFVLMGDHGARVYGAAEIPLASYEVPILFYAPGVIPSGRRVDTLASSLDVPPTVLGILGMEYDSKFFGHDVFRVAPSQGRALMTHNNEIALLRGGRMAVLGLHEAADLYAVDTATYRFTPLRHPDAAGRELIEDAISYYDGADVVYRNGFFQNPALVVTSH